LARLDVSLARRLAMGEAFEAVLTGDMVVKSMVAATSTKVKPRAQLHATALVLRLVLADEVAALKHLPCLCAVFLVSTPLFWR
jgi:hypothetical protein